MAGPATTKVTHYQVQKSRRAALIETDAQVTADTVVALPMLLDACRRLVAADDDHRRAERAAYAAELRELHPKGRGAWAQEAATRAAGSPVSAPRLTTGTPALVDVVCEPR
jgi:acetolactate synthase I/II/III large subunit